MSPSDPNASFLTFHDDKLVSLASPRLPTDLLAGLDYTIAIEFLLSRFYSSFTSYIGIVFFFYPKY